MGYSWSSTSGSWPVYNETFDIADVGGNGIADRDTYADGIIDAGEVSYRFASSELSGNDLENTWLGEVEMGCGLGSRGLRAKVMVGFRR